MSAAIHTRHFIKAVNGHEYELEYRTTNWLGEVLHSERRVVNRSKTDIRARDRSKHAEINKDYSWRLLPAANLDVDYK